MHMRRVLKVLLLLLVVPVAAQTVLPPVVPATLESAYADARSAFAGRTREKAVLMTCWERVGSSALAGALKMPERVCINTVQLELRWNRDGDLLASGVGMRIYPEDERTASYGAAFGQMTSPARVFRAEHRSLQAWRGPKGWTAEMLLSASGPDEQGRDGGIRLVLELDGTGKVTGSSVRGSLSCSDDRLCGGLVGELESLTYQRMR
ncbi:MAG: hypothetical protein AAB262_02150 [Elusimicrobiota bacterium]